MRKTILALAATVALSAPASAGIIYDLNAISLNPAGLSNFSIRFDDVSGDTLLQHSEIIAFSGLIQLPNTFYTEVACVPNIPNVSIQTGSCAGAQSPNNWDFLRTGGGLAASKDLWSYTINQITPAAVPLPPAVFLLAAAFGGLGLMRWWRNRRTRIELITA